jgi:hypothetical protein
MRTGRRQPGSAEDLAGILFRAEHDATVKSWGTQGACAEEVIHRLSPDELAAARVLLAPVTKPPKRTVLTGNGPDSRVTGRIGVGLVYTSFGRNPEETPQQAPALMPAAHRHAATPAHCPYGTAPASRG